HFDGKTIHQICKEKAVNETYLLNLLMVFTNQKFVPTETLPSYSVLQLTALTSAIYPFFLIQLDSLGLDIQKTLKSFKYDLDGKRSFSNKLKQAFDEYRSLLSDRFKQQKQIVLPHMTSVYEWYYSPDYTSKCTDILNYSVEFYDGQIHSILHSYEKIKQLLEQTLESNLTDLSYAKKVFAFYQLNHDILAQERIEQKLLKPLVLQMEESIITTFHKKNKTFIRNNYLSLPAESPSADELSHREKEVLQLVAQGLMNKEIADQLHIGLTTVISHRKNIVEKLHIKTISGLTVYAYTQGYLDDSILTNED
ncbi:MAG: helix-turn-helix transcriptional regulator, partial [Bacteroidales bacterium]|nr:helix-turn-helix transcriptional regulator [Bacteroidales bacterium]